MNAATPSLTLFRFIAAAMLLTGSPLTILAQVNDTGLYDNIKGLELYPPGYSPLPHSGIIDVITTPDGYDNFDVGIDNAEQHISSNPNNPVQMIFGVNGSGGARWRYTTDAGMNWTLSNPPGSNSGDPWSAWDSLGNLFIQFLSGSSNPVWRSTNNGATWAGPVTSATGGDRNTMAVDQTDGPYGGYLYAGAWSPNCTFARSTNNGASFTVTLTKPNTTPGNMIAVGADVLGGQNVQGGCVYFVSITGTNPQPTTFNFFRSTNGGASFDSMSSLTVAGYVGTLNSANRLVINNARTRPYPMIAADNSGGPYRGRLYLAYASNEPAGNGNKPDIFIQYSTDQGATWTPRAQIINDNANPTATNEWFPFIWCDKNTGRLYAKWYDMRNDLTNQRAWVYGTHSDDGAQTFAPNQKLSNTDMPYPGIPCSPNTNCYRGDYDAIVSAGNVAMAVWTDFRSNSNQNMLAYFPDFAMLVSPSTAFLGLTDSLDAVVKVPDVKLYTHSARFSATVSPAANFAFSFPEGDSLTSYPDSLTLRVKTGNVVPGAYTITVTGQGPNGTPVHKRTIEIQVVTNTNFVSLLQPNGGEEWLTGTTHDITWVRAGGVDSVKLEYSTNNGSSWTLITAAVNAVPQAYPWTLPSTPSTQSLVRVTWVDSANVTDQSDAVFSIVGSPVVGLTPDSLNVTIAEDSSTTRTLTISNTGLGPLDFTISIEDVSSSLSGRASPSGNAGRSATKPSNPSSTHIGQYADDATPPQAESLSGGTTHVGRWPRSIFDGSSSNLPDLMYYKFDEVGAVKTKNFANPATAVNDSADVLGGLSMGGSGQLGAALIGTGGSSSAAYVSTNWPTSLPGDWAVSMWLSNLPSGTTLYYLWGDVTAGSFRCFYTGAAGANNLLVRGPFNDVLITGVGPGPSVVDVIYDSSVPEIRAYVNGVLNRTVAQSLLTITGTSPFKIAGYSTLTGMPPGSLMDEFKLYNSLPSSITWLSVDTLSGTVPAGGTINVTATFDAAGLAPGDYYAEIVVQSNDPATPQVRTHAHLFVTPVTSVLEGESLPKEFALMQNFPNPFNPSTRIEYGLPEEANVSLKIFNVLGQEVTALAGGTQHAGYHAVEWNGTGSAGSPVSSGIYFYRFEAHSITGQTFIMMRKMILLK